jgi:hypothetical protein
MDFISSIIKTSVSLAAQLLPNVRNATQVRYAQPAIPSIFSRMEHAIHA